MEENEILGKLELACDAAMALAEEVEKKLVAARRDARNECRRADLAERELSAAVARATELDEAARESTAAAYAAEADLAALRAWAVDASETLRAFPHAQRHLDLAEEGRRLTGGKGAT